MLGLEENKKKSWLHLHNISTRCVCWFEISNITQTLAIVSHWHQRGIWAEKKKQEKQREIDYKEGRGPKTKREGNRLFL